MRLCGRVSAGDRDLYFTANVNRGNEKSRPLVCLKIGRLWMAFLLFERWRVRVMHIPKNPQIRRICISGSLFLFYASLFCK